MLGCREASGLAIQQRDSGPFERRTTGMIGFDIACESAGSGPRMQGYLVNDLCKTISADAKRTDFALAA
jgi:hypothetical protein